MTPWQIYPAIALATVVNAFALSFAWKAQKIEEATGEAPWWFIVGSLAYIAICGAFFYISGHKPVSTYPGFFMVAVAGQAMGVVFAIPVMKIVFRRPGPESQIFLAISALLFCFILIGPLFIG